MCKKHNDDKGFTLIELLVVVAIIGLLSSVVLVSLNSARKKARDAAIKEEVSQLTNLMVLNYSDYGSYCQLQSDGWVTLEGTCDSRFSGDYATQARAICNNIFNNAADLLLSQGYPAGSTRIFPSVSSVVGCSGAYSFIVGLNNGNWYCSGSSGVKGEYPSVWEGQPGCYQNP